MTLYGSAPDYRYIHSGGREGKPMGGGAGPPGSGTGTRKTTLSGQEKTPGTAGSRRNGYTVTGANGRPFVTTRRGGACPYAAPVSEHPGQALARAHFTLPVSSETPLITVNTTDIHRMLGGPGRTSTPKRLARRVRYTRESAPRTRSLAKAASARGRPRGPGLPPR